MCYSWDQWTVVDPSLGLSGLQSQVRVMSQRAAGLRRPPGTGSQNTHLDDALAGSQGQPHQAGAIDGHDLVPNAQLP